jgi:hypothetical protein
MHTMHTRIGITALDPFQILKGLHIGKQPLVLSLCSYALMIYVSADYLFGSVAQCCRPSKRLTIHYPPGIPVFKFTCRYRGAPNAIKRRLLNFG